MFPMVRIQEGLPVLTPPPVANLFFDVDILSVVLVSIGKKEGSTYYSFYIMYKMQNNTGQDLEECEYSLTFSFSAEGQVVKISDVKGKIEKWAADSWTRELKSPAGGVQHPPGKVLSDNARTKGTIEFIIDGKFEYFIPMWFSKTKNMTGNGGTKFK